MLLLRPNSTGSAGEPVSGTVPSALVGTLDAMALIRGKPTVSELAGPAEFRDVDSETGIEAVRRGFGVLLEAAGARSQERTVSERLCADGSVSRIPDVRSWMRL